MLREGRIAISLITTKQEAPSPKFYYRSQRAMLLLLRKQLLEQKSFLPFRVYHQTLWIWEWLAGQAVLSEIAGRVKAQIGRGRNEQENGKGREEMRELEAEVCKRKMKSEKRERNIQ